jgi:hypothetical protein
MPLYVLVARKEEFNFTNSLLISRGLKAAALLIVTTAARRREGGTIRRNWLSSLGEGGADNSSRNTARC